MDQIVTLETARLAEEVGFNGKVLHFYNHGENKLIPITLLISPPTPISVEHLETTPATLPVDCVPAPTQTALSRWLREKHDMYVSVDIAIFKRGWNACIISIPKELVCTNARGFDTYEEAMEEGLKLACKIVKERRSE